ncbi:hypothetical protein CA7LBN_000390 [Candidozyma auris]|uniref:Ribosomal protein S8 n=1 Tax=Candidozyma auris TaxID=498019 RepID=A0A8F3AEE6_CANAR|nr:hypothetical protein CA7LBN_000390 [[Candida] auris]
MSLVSLANFCAHLKNCTNVNIGLTSVPLSRLHLQGSTVGPDKKPVDVTPDNIATRRLWLGLKYRDNRPVIRDLQLVSKPGRKVNLSLTEVKALASGFPVRFIKPLQPAECIFLKTPDNEVVEIQEAAKRDLHGLALCRVK